MLREEGSSVNARRLLASALLASLMMILGCGHCSISAAPAGPCDGVIASPCARARLSGRGALVCEERADWRCWPLVADGSSDRFAFAVTCDMRVWSGPGEYDTPQFFRGACEAIDALGCTAFMVSPGDIDPPEDVEWTIRQYLGQDYLWYPVVGNHEAETLEDMEWLRAYDYDRNGDEPPNIANTGPSGCEETSYSFDYGNSHFVVLNEYWDGDSDTGASGDVVDELYDWLVDDLSATHRTHLFVFGHEPAYPQPDADNGRARHMSDSLSQYPARRDRLWELLKDKGVVAYMCGHTHNYSAVEIDGVWQLDAGHARGRGDTGARSTFLLIEVNGETVTFETYRDDASGGAYLLADRGVLAGTHIHVPAVMQTDKWGGGAKTEATVSRRSRSALAPVGR